MKKFALTYLFVVLATTLLLALLKLAGSPATTWGWVAFPILGSLVMWLLFIGAVTTVGLIWPEPKTLTACTRLHAERDVPATSTEQHESYYRKALALELATMAHDTPGLIEWQRTENKITATLHVIENEHA